MTIATDRGFKIGALYRVIDAGGSNIYTNNMIVRFHEDDGTDSPYFAYYQGPKNTWTDNYDQFCITLDYLESVDIIKQAPSTKELLLLYVQQRHSSDIVLNTLVKSL